MKSAAGMAALLLWACGGDSVLVVPAPSARIVLNANSPRPTIDVVDVPAAQLHAIEGTGTRDEWTAILKVSVAADQPPADGQYAVEDGRIRFTPMFPLDHGRQYLVTFTPPGGEPVSATVGLPAAESTPKTFVAEVFPTADVLPENQLRLDIHFSEPMGMLGGFDFVHLLDASGQPVKDPFLPLDAAAWNEERTRYTVFFDPQRHNDEARSLAQGASYTLVIDAEWHDGHGLPLKQAFRRGFTVGPPDERPLDPQTWKVAAPAAGSSAALIVAFPEPLDHESMLRGLSVSAPGGKTLEGEAVIGPGELTWSFTPVEPWKAGEYNIVALAMLADLAGNRIGRAFDAEHFDRTGASPASGKTLIPLSVR